MKPDLVIGDGVKQHRIPEPPLTIRALKAQTIKGSFNGRELRQNIDPAGLWLFDAKAWRYRRVGD